MTFFNNLHPVSTFRLYLLAFVSCATLMSFDSHAEPTNDKQPKFQYSTQTTTPVIEYNLVHEMIAEPDAEPLLRIYGSGRVHVHIPAYMKNSGDFEIQLSRNKLNALIQMLSEEGVIDFDHRSARENMTRLRDQRRATTGALWEVSDVTETVIKVNLDSYQRNPTSTPLSGIKKHFSWKKLQHDARRYPESITIQRAAASARMLHGIIQSPDLKRMKQ